MKNITDITAQNSDAQQQLSFANSNDYCSRRRRQRRLVNWARAKFWFGQMHRAVDAAVEWKPAPLPRPEQAILDLHRPVEVAVKSS